MRRKRSVGDKFGDRDKPKLGRLGASEFVPKNGQGDARTWARWHFLQVVARQFPNVMVDLQTRAISLTTKNSTPATFVQYWRLPAWTLPYVQSTWRFSAERPDAKRTYWLDRDDIVGELIAESQAPAAPDYDPFSSLWAPFKSGS